MAFQTFTGKQYLAIDIASNYGLDKQLWDERLAWFEAHEAQLEELMPQAKEPALYFAGVKAWRQVQKGEAIGYPISLDATSSGLQILAVLTGDRSAAQLCNVVDTGRREDAYKAIYHCMVEHLGDEARIDREKTKQAIMTAFYNSKAVPKKVFGEGVLLTTFYETLSQLAPAAWELNEVMLTLWNPDALSHDWVLPDNFHVRTKVMSQVKDTVHFLNQPFDVFYNVNAPTAEGRSLGANTVHSIDAMIVREMTRRCSYDPLRIEALRLLVSSGPYKADPYCQDGTMVVKLWDHYQETGYLSARILDHLTDQTMGLVDRDVIRELLDSLPKKPFKVLSVHQWCT